MTLFAGKTLGLGWCVVACVGVGLAGGCQQANPAVKRSEQAASLLVDTRTSLVTGEQKVADSQAALKTLSESNGDLRPTFELFTAELELVRKEAQRVARDGETVRAQSAAYCTARASDVNTISNEELRRSAEVRTAKMKQQCDTVNALYGQVNTAFARYVTHLSDLRTYLASELNHGSLEAGQRWIDEAMASGEMLRGHIRSLALQVDLTSNILSPVPIATTEWQTTLSHPDALAAQR